MRESHQIEVGDLDSIRLECVSCGAALVLKVKKWTRIPEECPAGCGNEWAPAGSAGPEFAALNQLRVGLQAVRGLSSLQFRITFERAEGQ